jgi:hypothetical protein
MNYLFKQVPEDGKGRDPCEPLINYLFKQVPEDGKGHYPCGTLINYLFPGPRGRKGT